jgi:hypothetical protein
MKSRVNIEVFQRLPESDTEEEGLLDAILRLGTIEDVDELSSAVKGAQTWGSWSGWSW